MSCKNHQEELSSLLDRKLSAGEQEKVLAHVESCRECRGRLDSMTALRKELRAMPHPAVPAHLSSRLWVTASHERARQLARASLTARWNAWTGAAQLWFDNLMRPLALPFAGGLFSAMVSFSVLLPMLSFSHNFGESNFYTNADGIVVLQATDGSYQPVRDDNNFVRILRPGDEIPTDYSNVVGLTVDANGRVRNFSVERGELTPELLDIIMMGVFDPAEYLGSKVSATVLVGQHVHSHTARRGRSMRS
jgi:hypothetical protein